MLDFKTMFIEEEEEEEEENKRRRRRRGRRGGGRRRRELGLLGKLVQCTSSRIIIIKMVKAEIYVKAMRF